MKPRRLVGRGLDAGVLWRSVAKTRRRPGELRVLVEADTDVVDARRKGREFATVLGFRPVEAKIVATVVSDLARQILRDVGRGEIVVATPEEPTRRGLVMTVRYEEQGLGRVLPRLPGNGTAAYRRWLRGLKHDELQIMPDVRGGAIVTVRWNV